MTEHGALTSLVTSDDQTKHFQTLIASPNCPRDNCPQLVTREMFVFNNPELVTGNFKCHCFNIYCDVLLVFLIQDKGACN